MATTLAQHSASPCRIVVKASTLLTHWPAAFCAALSLAGCGDKTSRPAPGDAPVVRIDGSSTVFPIAEAVSEEFQLEERGGVRVTVGLSGTGGGFKKLCRGDADISNASRPILTEEMEACRAAGVEFIELPSLLTRSRSWSIRRTTGSSRSRSRISARSGNPPRRASSHDGTRCDRNGPTRRSCCLAPAPIPGRSTTLRRRWSGRRSPVAATTRRAKTTTCSCRAWSATRMRSDTSALHTTSLTRSGCAPRLLRPKAAEALRPARRR